MDVGEYVNSVPAERKVAFIKMREAIKNALPQGFQEEMNYGMIGFVVPHSRYPSGYHCNPKDPLPFIGLASQKGSINLYHMGLYLDQTLMDWFLKECSKVAKHKVDFGKSCFRFKYMDEIPYEAIGKLCEKISVSQWIQMYEEKMKK